EQHGDTLYAGGDFTVAGGIVARGIAMWNGSEWKPLGTGTDELNGINGQVYALLAQDNNLYVGGHFSMAGGEAAFHIARWDGTKWWPMGIGVGGTSGAEVHAIAKNENYVYVAGYFGMVGDVENYQLPANSIARFNLTTDRWETLGRGIEVTQGVPGRVYDMDWHGDTLFVVGEFYNADDMFSENVAALVNDKWVIPDPGHSYGIHGKVMKVKSIGNELYIGGLLKMTIDEESHGIMRWRNGYWEDVGEKLSANNDDVWVNDMVTFDSGFIAGGYFRLAGGMQVNNMAYYDGYLWKPVYGGILPGISCMAVTGYDLYVAGARYMYTTAGVNMGLARLGFEPPVIVGNEDVVRTESRLSIYPNPAAEAARIRFILAETGNVTIQVFDSRGNQVMNALNEHRVAGEHTVLLNTSSLPRGFYSCRMVSGGYSETVKILVQ
ncbi:MAG TPA: T9SS type A sorting domain-containing protein, partial [Bacteroidales bacterium]|nr:T9SS type A sorting domain-containing protein [Bacteroidales bacterium]